MQGAQAGAADGGEEAEAASPLGARPDALPHDAALREVIEQVVGAAPDKLYVDCVFSSAERARWLLSLLGQGGRLRSFVLDATLTRAALAVQEEDPRFQAVVARPLGDFQAAVREPVNGVFFDMGALKAQEERSESGAEAAAEDERLGACLHRQDGDESAMVDWLRSISGGELAWVIDRFGILYDPLLSERIAEGILLRQRERGVGESLSQLVNSVLEEFRQEFEPERPYLRGDWVLRAIRIFRSQAPAQLRTALEQAFALLEPEGRCAVASVRKWEMEVVRRFVHDHEEPKTELLEGVPLERLAQLFPLLSSGKDFSVTLAARPQQCAQRALLHVLARAPRTAAPSPVASPAAAATPAALRPPAPPAFGAGEGQEATGSEAAGAAVAEWSPEELQELVDLKRRIVERKAELKSAGQSLSEQKKDRQISEWTAHVNRMHKRGQQYTERVRARCRDLPHVPVLLEEAVDAVMALGPDGLYVDCTFGRGGHTKLILSRLSEKGRLKAFDVDEVAVEVARGLASTDRRLEALQSPFGRLRDAVGEPVAGVLLDSGVSTPQLQDTSRGFNHRDKKDGPLDLRMDQGTGLPASAWLQTVSVAELAWVIYTCGHSLDRLLSERVAEGILERQRREGPYATTRQLAEAVEASVPDFSEAYPRLSLPQIVFAAVRAFLNREMEQLTLAMEGALEVLQVGGRLVMITFSTWEPVAVRRFLRCHEEPSSEVLAALPRERLVELYPLLGSSQAYTFRRVSAPLRPGASEVSANGRSRTALLHVLEKVPRRSPVQPLAAVSEPGHATGRLREPAPVPRQDG